MPGFDRSDKMPYGRGITDDLMHSSARLGDFEIVSVISVTLLGAFYYALDHRHDEEVCIQVIPRFFGGDSRSISRIENTIRTLQTLSHRNILRPSHLERIDGVAVIVYDPADVVASTDYLLLNALPDGGLPEDSVRKIVSQVSSALHAVNEQKIGHGALTPENILISADGSVVVTGFGILEAIDPQRFEMFVSSAIVPIRETSSRCYFTALEVLSPEYRNNKAHDIRSDIYALGLVQSFLLSGRKLEQPLDDLWDFRPDICAGWKVLLNRMLAEKPDERYPTVTALQADLSRIKDLRMEAGKSKRISSLFKTFRGGAGLLANTSPARRRRIARTLLLGLFGFVVVGIGGISFQRLLLDEDPLIEEKSYRVQNLSQANLILKITPSMAKVTVKGAEEESFFAADGVLLLLLRPGKYELVVQAANYEPIQQEVTVGSSPQEIPLELALSWAELEIHSISGARVNILGEGGQRRYLDTVPESGVLLVKHRLFATRYDLEVTAPGHLPTEWRDLGLSSRNKTVLEAKLIPFPASLVVLSTPEGLEVIIDDKVMGTTPLLLDNLTSAKPIRVMISDRQFRSVPKEIQMKPGEQAIVDFGNMERSMAHIAVDIQLPWLELIADRVDLLEVKVGDSTFSGRTKLNISLPPDTYTFQISHPDYEIYETIVDLEDDVLTTTHPVLRPKEALLTVMVKSGDPYVIFVNGEPVEKPQDPIRLTAGNQAEISVQVRDHLAVQRQFVPRPNEQISWEVPLRRLPAAEAGKDWRIPYQNVLMPWMDPGTFLMGSPLPETMRLPNEDTRTEVSISKGFWIGQFEVTQELYFRVMRENPSQFKGTNRPVDSVTWEEAVEFTRRLNEIEQAAKRVPEGYEYRLPTEAEWEYAARAGSRGAFHFGEYATAQNGHFQGQYPPGYGSLEVSGTSVVGTVEVGRYRANSWGLHDVHGNVREWILDAYNERLPGGKVRDWFRKEGNRGNVYKGGGWNDSAHRCRSAAREGMNPGLRSNSQGFRFVLGPVIKP